MGTLYPPDIFIGIIEKAEPLAGTDFFEAKVTLSQDFKNLEFVYIVEHLDASELEWLENKNQEIDGN
jgi:cell shape-determining protein MreC